ncbi:hypothetical protein REMIM1_PE00274 (plasmid) [Rhizobium etli bv. mimosae str. Mim1]|nr:hypothetical protein REMIM1_PE00274 [Rhizobium etli bv. mimosae str. Mim1]
MLAIGGVAAPRRRQGDQAISLPRDTVSAVARHTRTPEDTRIRLKAMDLTLDPVRLLRDIRLAQERLVEIADKSYVSAGGGGEALRLEEFLSGLRIAWRVGEVRSTARSKPAAKRERRRPDPLFAVTESSRNGSRGIMAHVT